MMEGDVAEKDNVLLTLCCSKNSYNQENGEGEGAGRGLSTRSSQIHFLHGSVWISGLRQHLDLRLEGGG